MSREKRTTLPTIGASLLRLSVNSVAITALVLTAVLALSNGAFAQPPAVTCHIEWAPMRDGTLLATEVYLPSDQQGPLPVVMQRSPYNEVPPSPGSNCNNAQLVYLAAHEYAALNQDVRGMYRSQGTFHAMVQEANDGYDAIEWAAAQPWSTGKVGMFSGSYVGLTQWQPAIHTPPHLAAIAPQVTASDYHDNWTYVNSAFDLWFAQSWILLTFGPETYKRELLATGLPLSVVMQRVNDWIAEGRRDILTKWVWQLPLTSFSEFRRKAPYYYSDWLANPTYDSFWAQLDVEPRYSHVTVPTLNIGGWYDIFQVGTVRNFLGMRSEGGTAQGRNGSKLFMRASCHACPADTTAGIIDFGPNNTLDVNTLLVRWFDHWLKGIDNGIDREPPVNLFVMVPPDAGTKGNGFWITADDYPLPSTQFTNFNLRSGGHANTRSGDGVLASNLPAAGPPDQFVYDPYNPVPTNGGNMCCINNILASGAFDQTSIETRDDVLVYTGAPLTEDTAVIGPTTVRLWAISSAPDTDFTAKLVDVHPDGFAQNVLDRIVRARYRAGSKLPPSLITPGQAYEYTIDLGNTATILKAGHRIRLEISSSNFPHYVRNQNTVQEPGQDSKVAIAAQTLLHDAAHPSYLKLPIVPSVHVP